MSKTETVICDRCGAEIISFNVKYISAKLNLWATGVNRYEPGQRIDLCEDCFNAFIAFMEGGGEKEKK